MNKYLVSGTKFVQNHANLLRRTEFLPPSSQQTFFNMVRPFGLFQFAELILAYGRIRCAQNIEFVNIVDNFWSPVFFIPKYILQSQIELSEQFEANLNNTLVTVLAVILVPTLLIAYHRYLINKHHFQIAEQIDKSVELLVHHLIILSLSSVRPNMQSPVNRCS